ncbi:MAG: hypothetical protein WC371_03315, partial [Parachlamydiales bacterium]
MLKHTPKFWFWLFTPWLAFNLLFAEQLVFVIDPKMTSDSGAKDLLSLHKALENAEHRPFKKPIENRFGAFLYRLADLYLWEIINSTTHVAQHEIFGHGYRLRDFGKNYFDNIGYRIKVYSGYTSFNIKKTHPFQLSAIDQAGVEGSAILAKNIKMSWMKNNRLNPFETSLYLATFNDIYEYILSTKLYAQEDELSPLDHSGHDIHDYCVDLNLTYLSSPIKASHLRHQAWINALDPFSYLSLSSFFYYLFWGREMPLYMIPVCQLKYLPGLRYSLTPF